MPLPYFYSFDTSRPPHLSEKMAIDADSVLIEYIIPNECGSSYKNSYYYNDFNDEPFDLEKENIEEELPSITAPAPSCEQHMDNTNVAPPTQNPELELPESHRSLEYMINFEQVRNEQDPTVPVQGEMSADRFESPQPYQYTDLNDSWSQTGNFGTLGDVQFLANQGSGLTNVQANVYYMNFGNDLTTNANFTQEQYNLLSPEIRNFYGTETVSSISQASISEVKDTEDGPLKCKWSNCGKGFSSITKLAKHLKESHVKTIQQLDFICLWKGCSRRLSSSYRLLAHLRFHSGEKPFKCTISGCNKAFTVPESLKIHRRSHT